MININVDFNKNIGKIKPVHGVGQPPITGVSTKYFNYLSEANIPYSRLHDVGGWFGKNMFVDIPNVFRDFDADENDPASYDFAFTDILIEGLIRHNCMPIYRLGVTIENFHNIKAYRIYPPKDFAKWARICEHVIRHYNEGWADGFYYGIKYWEIWNEPDNSSDPAKNAMWKGTKQEFFDLYATASTHLKKCFGDKIKVGGYASCGFYSVCKDSMADPMAFGRSEPIDLDVLKKLCDGYLNYFLDFIEFVKKEKLPLDFFSYHSYGNVKDVQQMEAYVEKKLRDEGFADTEIQLNEWNPHFQIETRGSSLAAATATAMLIALQNTNINLACFYDARMDASMFCGLFNPYTYKPVCTYYGFKAFGELYALGEQVECTFDCEDLYVAAATDKTKKAVLISNLGESRELSIDIDSSMKVYLIDADNMMTETDYAPTHFTIQKNQVIFIA